MKSKSELRKTAISSCFELFHRNVIDTFIVAADDVNTWYAIFIFRDL